MNLRIGTFNAQNLFERAKALNLEEEADTANVIKKIGDFQALLKQSTYDKAGLWAAWLELKTYIDVNVEAGTFWKKRGNAVIGIAATGPDDWKGSVVFKKAPLNEIAREGTARIIKDLKADVLCMVEAEGNEALCSFNSDLLNRRYSEHLLIDSPNDPRGIDVGLFVRNGRIRTVRTHAFDRNPTNSREKIFSRDCLRVEVALASGHTLHLLCNHFKSKLSTNAAASDARRKRQADRVAEILNTDYNLETDLVAVLGDFNDTPDSTALQDLLALPNLTDVFVRAGVPDADRWTYYYHSRKQKTQIDFILVSKPLADALEKVEVMRRGMTGVVQGYVQGVAPYPSMTSWRQAASDHAGLVAEFAL